MSNCRLFCPIIAEGSITLSAEESHHAISSLRARPGQEVVLFDGAGGEATAVIRQIARRRLVVDVVRRVHRPFDLSFRLTLAVALPRAHRQGYLIEKCTELGVAAIWPITSDRSVTRPDAAAVEKWSRRAIEAAKQSHLCWVPLIAAPRTFTESLKYIGDFARCAITDVDSFRADTPAKSVPFSIFLAGSPAGASILAAVGPEGGWTDDEVALAVHAGAVRTTLAPTILRTETAAVAVCAAVALADRCSS